MLIIHSRSYNIKKFKHCSERTLQIPFLIGITVVLSSLYLFVTLQSHMQDDDIHTSFQMEVLMMHSLPPLIFSFQIKDQEDYK